MTTSTPIASSGSNAGSDTRSAIRARNGSRSSTSPPARTAKPACPSHQSAIVPGARSSARSAAVGLVTVHLPPDRGVLSLWVDALAAQRSVARGAHHATRVVVHAEEVEPAVVSVELPVPVGPVEVDHVRGIPASEERVEEPAVQISIHAH